MVTLERFSASGGGGDGVGEGWMVEKERGRMEEG